MNAHLHSPDLPGGNGPGAVPVFRFTRPARRCARTWFSPDQGDNDPALFWTYLVAALNLAEIRAADLRFTPGEAMAYLNEVMGLALTAAGIPASAVAEIQPTLATRCYSQHSPFARPSSSGYSVSMASRAVMIRPVSCLVRR
jgi:hypothetical protein